MARYGLANHVFVCRDREFIVVLDLKRDRYFSLDAARTTALSPFLPGWPALAAGEKGGVAVTTEEAAAPLVSRGWLLEAPAVGKEATPVRPSLAEAELTSDIEAAVAPARLGLRTLVAFVTASLFAKFALRFWRFERVIRRVSRRRKGHATEAHSLDIEQARCLVATFMRLRVFLFSSRDKCLYDSFALLEFLARYGLFPGWVFGVRALPFAAHCWVQYDDIVFNDTVEHVRGYTPIMVV
jgi:hypothetical protein